jgi:transglutaminase-like putative cysteine protease
LYWVGGGKITRRLLLAIFLVASVMAICVTSVSATEENQTIETTNNTTDNDLEEGAVNTTNQTNKTNTTIEDPLVKVKYSYTVKTAYKQKYKSYYKSWYKKWYKKTYKRSYKRWYKSYGRWKYYWKSSYSYKWTYKWTYKWKYQWKYRTAYKYQTKYAYKYVKQSELDKQINQTNSSLQQYLKSTNNCQSTDSRIKALAKSITKGLTSNYDKANALFKWVRDKVSYTFYYNTKYGAIKTMERKNANCIDQSHLLIALARASGIPAKYAHAQCKFTSMTVGHIWAELYVNGKWITADPTSSRNTFGTQNNCKILYWKGRYAQLPF